MAGASSTRLVPFAYPATSGCLHLPAIGAAGRFRFGGPGDSVWGVVQSMPNQKPYSEFASLYDWVMDGVKYEMWADYVCRISKRFGVTGTKLLDIACGTGNTSFTMARRGYIVTGLDISPQMLAVAQQKRSSLDIASQVRFVCEDMRQFSLDETYDVITCLYDSINYLTDPGDLVKTFKCVRAHMKPTSLFILDVNTEHQLALTKRNHPTLFERGEDVALFWRDEWCPRTKIWRVRLDGFVKDGDKYRRFTEIHEERAYSISEIEEALSQAGLDRSFVFDAYSFNPPRHDSARLYFVAQL